jgi:hypothetical protein
MQNQCRIITESLQNQCNINAKSMQHQCNINATSMQNQYKINADLEFQKTPSPKLKFGSRPYVLKVGTTTESLHIFSHTMPPVLCSFSNSYFHNDPCRACNPTTKILKSHELSFPHTMTLVLCSHSNNYFHNDSCRACTPTTKTPMSKLRPCRTCPERFVPNGVGSRYTWSTSAFPLPLLLLLLLLVSTEQGACSGRAGRTNTL